MWGFEGYFCHTTGCNLSVPVDCYVLCDWLSISPFVHVCIVSYSVYYTNQVNICCLMGTVKWHWQRAANAPCHCVWVSLSELLACFDNRKTFLPIKGCGEEYQILIWGFILMLDFPKGSFKILLWIGGLECLIKGITPPPLYSHG